MLIYRVSAYLFKTVLYTAYNTCLYNTRIRVHCAFVPPVQSETASLTSPVQSETGSLSSPVQSETVSSTSPVQSDNVSLTSPVQSEAVSLNFPMRSVTVSFTSCAELDCFFNLSCAE
jgi:hypothetical protein